MADNEEIVIDITDITLDNGIIDLNKEYLQEQLTTTSASLRAEWTAADNTIKASITEVEGDIDELDEKIDEVEINCATKTHTHKLSTLNNDANYVVDARYVHTDNNYTSTEKQDLATAKTNITNILANMEVYNSAFSHLPTVENSRILTVGDVGARFTKINDAITYARTYCSKTNRVLIVIYPGTYNEEITLRNNPGIDFIGSGTNNTIIQYASEYPHAPVYTDGDGYFADITFKYLPCTDASRYCYAVHYELLDSTYGGETIFERCSFINTVQKYAAGCGMGSKCILRFIDCSFQAKDYISAGVHNQCVANVEDHHAWFERCKFLSQDSRGISISAENAAGQWGFQNTNMYVHFIDNTAVVGNFGYRYGAAETYTNYIPDSDSQIRLANDSHGNNIESMNAAYTKANFLGYVIKPTVYVEYGGVHKYFMFAPYVNADKYTWTVTQAVIPGVGERKHEFTIESATQGGINLVTTYDEAAGKPYAIALVGTPKTKG